MTSSNNVSNTVIEHPIDVRVLEATGVVITQGFIEYNNRLYIAELTLDNPELANAIEQWATV